MAGNYLTLSRSGTIFHFRRRIPDDLRPTIGRPYLIKSLGTGHRREAIILARALAAHTDELFHHLRTMPSDQNNPANIRTDFGFKLEMNELGRVTAITITDAKSEEREAVNSVIETTLKNLPPPHQPPAASVATVTQPVTGKIISEVWQSYKTEKIAANTWRDGEHCAKYHHWPHVRTLIEVIGDKPLDEITADDINKFQSHVLTDTKGGSPSNRDKRLTRAGAVLRWAKKKRLTSDDFAELFRYPRKIEANPYVAFDTTDLKMLFESDDYKHRAFKTPSEYWLPVLALHTGARLNELCQLTVSDIKQHDGIETITILDEDMGKRLKTPASRRIVPIHSQLITLGFLRYVSTIKAGRIFPELPEDPARPGNYGAKSSELFTAYRRKCGVGKTGVRSNKAFHSFRSTLISALRKIGVPKDRRTRLAGHEYEDTQDKTYHGGDVKTMFDFAILKADLERVQFDVALTPYLAR